MTQYLDRLFALNDRIAVVTGGSSGIGRAIGAALASAGALVVLIARRADALADARMRIRAAGGEAGWVSADLGDRAEVARGAEEAAALFGEPDILVCAAGINLRPPMDALTTDDWDQTMAVNLAAPFLLGQRFGPGMAGRGWGRIINVTSQQAARAFGNSGARGPHHGRPQRPARRFRGRRRLPRQPGQRLRHRPGHPRRRRLLGDLMPLAARGSPPRPGQPGWQRAGCGIGPARCG